MAIHKLKAKEIDALPYGNWPDGGNLYVCVNKDGSSRSWGLRITKFGLDTFMMLGPTYTYSLAEARGWATKQRQLMKEGVNPLQARRDAAHEAKRAVDRNTPFAEVAKQWLAVMA